MKLGFRSSYLLTITTAFRKEEKNKATQCKVLEGIKLLN